MKIKYLSIVLFYVLSNGLLAYGSTPIPPIEEGKHLSFLTSTTLCGQDTLQYSRAKGDLTNGVIAGIGLSGPFTGAGQRFEVPEGASVEVTGFALHARIINADAPVQCAIYETDMNGLPTGEALAVKEMLVTANDTISYINFNIPVTVTSDFVVTAELMSATPLAVNTNNGMMGAGQGEKLALLLFQGNWVVAETAGPPGAFNLDFIMEPFVNYDISAGVSSDVVSNTVYADSTYNFTSNHSPIVNSRFFNKIAFDAYFGESTESPTDWDFGDGSALENGDEVSHVFSAGADTYVVTTSAKVEGFTTTCEDVIEMTFDLEVISATEDEFFTNSTSIYPNPTNGLVYIDLQMQKAQQVNVRVYNLLGQEIANYPLGTVKDKFLNIDLSNQQVGTYFVTIVIDGRSKVHKLIVQ
ncbi:MAG: T9SS type A sorting domain-containing protein [Saprospiraceae bacterium]|nr:T9SS type A sorting domain-containing protein [Saprospiraceae bacterium]